MFSTQAGGAYFGSLLGAKRGEGALYPAVSQSRQHRYATSGSAQPPAKFGSPFGADSLFGNYFVNPSSNAESLGGIGPPRP